MESIHSGLCLHVPGGGDRALGEDILGCPPKILEAVGSCESSTAGLTAAEGSLASGRPAGEAQVFTCAWQWQVVVNVAPGPTPQGVTKACSDCWSRCQTMIQKARVWHIEWRAKGSLEGSGLVAPVNRSSKSWELNFSCKSGSRINRDLKIIYRNYGSRVELPRSLILGVQCQGTSTGPAHVGPAVAEPAGGPLAARAA